MLGIWILVMSISLIYQFATDYVYLINRFFFVLVIFMLFFRHIAVAVSKFRTGSQCLQLSVFPGPTIRSVPVSYTHSPSPNSIGWESLSLFSRTVMPFIGGMRGPQLYVGGSNFMEETKVLYKENHLKNTERSET